MRTDIINHLQERLTRQTETLLQTVEAALATRPPVEHQPRSAGESPKVRSITEAASRQRANGHDREVDTITWPLFVTGKAVRAIASQTNISADRVGRSRQRCKLASGVSGSSETAKHPAGLPIAE